MAKDAPQVKTVVTKTVTTETRITIPLVQLEQIIRAAFNVTQDAAVRFHFTNYGEELDQDEACTVTVTNTSISEAAMPSKKEA